MMNYPRKKKCPQPEEEESAYDLIKNKGNVQATCPNNSYFSSTDLQNLVGKTNYIINDVNKSKVNGHSCTPQQGDCKYLYNSLVGNQMKDTDLMTYLGNMKNQELRNQIKYNLGQLVECSAKIKAIEKEPAFGTWEWWEKNVWGANKIQNYIYIVSFLVAIIAMVYFLYRLFSGDFLEILMGDSDLGYLLGFTYLLIFTISFLVIAFYYSFSQKPYWEDSEKLKEEEAKMKDYIAYDSDYEKYYSEKGYSSEPPSYWLGTIFGIMVSILTVLTLYVGYQTEKGKNIGGLSTLSIFLVLTWLGLLLVFNLYFSFLLPQILILGLILQKIFIDFPTPWPPSWGNLSHWSTKIFLLLVIFIGLVSYYTRFNWLLFLIILGYFVLSMFSDKVYGKDYRVGWNFFLTPYADLIFSALSGGELKLSSQ